MKKFYSEKELLQYLEGKGINKTLVDSLIYVFLGTQGSEIFESEKKINVDAFEYEGIKVNGNITIYIASVPVDGDGDTFKDIYMVEE